MKDLATCSRHQAVQPRPFMISPEPLTERKCCWWMSAQALPRAPSPMSLPYPRASSPGSNLSTQFSPCPSLLSQALSRGSCRC